MNIRSSFFSRENFTLTNMTEAVLLDAGMPKDAAGIVLKHKAAITLQSFFRRSQWCVEYETEHSITKWPLKRICRPGTNGWHPVNDLHGSANFTQEPFPFFNRVLPYRYKPLGIALKAMMVLILHGKTSLRERSLQYKKRKNLSFKVTLKYRTKHFGDIPIISVTHETVF